MQDLEERLKQIGQVAIQNLSWPTREPSYNKPPFWAVPLNITRARPLVSGGGWVNAVSIPKLNSNKIIVKGYVATSEVEGAVSFRWVRNNQLFNPNFLDLTPGIERHIERTLAHPFPCIWRGIFIQGLADDTIILQARNDSGSDQLTFAGVWGWYYPDLQNPNELTAMEGIDDVRRDF